MSPGELYKFLVDMCSEPNRLAAFLTGLALGAGVVAWLGWLFFKPKKAVKRRLDQMRQVTDKLTELLDVPLKQLPGRVQTTLNEAQQLSVQIQSLQKEVVSHQQTNQALCAQLSQHKHHLDENATAIQNLNKQLAQSKKKHEEQDEAIQELNNQLATLKRRSDRLEIEKHGLEQSNQQLELGKQGLEGNLRKLGEQLTAANSELSETTHSLKRLSDRNTKLTEEHRSLQEEAKNWKATQSGFEGQIAALSSKRKELEQSISDLSTQVRELKQQIGVSGKHAQELEKQLTAAKRSWEATSTSLEQLKNQNAELTTVRLCLLQETDQLKRTLSECNNQIAILTNKRTELEKTSTDLSGKIHQLNQQIETSKKREQDLIEQVTKLISTSKSQNGEAALEKEQAGDSDNEVASLTERVWERIVEANTIPTFRTLSERKMPIISVVNLKGGVGKTTVTANLGATLWTKSNQVLLIDLDFQASLTLRCLSQAQEEFLGGTRSIRHFFVKPTDNPTNELLEKVIKINFADRPEKLVPQLGKGYLIGADELLADIENGRMLNWIQRRHEADVRFHLRGALHAPNFQGKYTHVLIDCPPRLTTACINALAASDYVLVPVLLDATSAERVPLLLAWLGRLMNAQVCPNLLGVGVLVNRLSRSDSDQEKQDLAELKAQCAQYRSSQLQVRVLETHLFEDKRFFAIAARKRWPAVLRKRGEFDGIRQNFLDLADELSKELS